jgi:hypothetical protein
MLLIVLLVPGISLITHRSSETYEMRISFRFSEVVTEAAPVNTGISSETHLRHWSPQCDLTPDIIASFAWDHSVLKAALTTKRSTEALHAALPKLEECLQQGASQAFATWLETERDRWHKLQFLLTDQVNRIRIDSPEASTLISMLESEVMHLAAWDASLSQIPISGLFRFATLGEPEVQADARANSRMLSLLLMTCLGIFLGIVLSLTADYLRELIRSMRTK